jgi:hypothetical protein
MASRDILTMYRLLQRYGFSQRRIAALTGQSQSEVFEILCGRRVTTYDLLVRIADGPGAPRAGWDSGTTDPSRHRRRSSSGATGGPWVAKRSSPRRRPRGQATVTAPVTWTLSSATVPVRSTSTNRQNSLRTNQPGLWHPASSRRRSQPFDATRWVQRRSVTSCRPA